MSHLITAIGYWTESPRHELEVIISTGAWDGNENDNDIFYYTDGEPIAAGDVIAGGFVILDIAQEITE
jgi:hypothetical protein